MDGGPSRSFQGDNGAEPEWPFNDTVDAGSSNRTVDSSRSSLRLLVIQSPVLPPRRKIAVLDVHDEVQIGRDGSTSELMPRLRLKDMEVSKLHATVFWDVDREEWAIVDMGSKHGTFLRSVSSSGTAVETRLSGSRASSLPRPLRHLDELSFGRTIFTVHIHAEGLPCDDCSPSDESSSIPLFSKSASSQPVEQPKTTSVANTASTSTSAKEVLGSLKRRLLTEHAIPDSKRSRADSSQTRYVDRSSLRRALYPPSRGAISLPVPDARPASASSSRNSSTHARTVARYHMQPTTDISPPNSASIPPMPAPIPKSNIGHRLLEKQGWFPGASLGKIPSDFGLDPANARTALLEPLQVPANVGKQGLGSSRSTLP